MSYKKDFFYQGPLKNRGLVVNEAPRVRVRHYGGALVSDAMYSAALAVIRGDAVVLGKGDHAVEPIPVVACRLEAGTQLKSVTLGSPLLVVDPGDEHADYILLSGNVSTPTIAKGMTRPLEPCQTTVESCQGCVNNPQRQ